MEMVGVRWYWTWMSCCAEELTLVAKVSVSWRESCCCTVMRAEELPSVPTKAGSILTEPTPKSLPTRLETVALSAPPSSALVVGSVPACDLLLLVDLRLFLGAAEREQGEDVGLGERRLGAVGGLEVGGGAVQADGDVVVLHAGGGVEVDDGVDADRVGEVDVAALQLVLGAGEGGGAVGDLDAAEDGGFGDGAADGEVDGAGELGVASSGSRAAASW